MRGNNTGKESYQHCHEIHVQESMLLVCLYSILISVLHDTLVLNTAPFSLQQCTPAGD